MIKTILASSLAHLTYSSLGPIALYQALSPLNLTLVSPGGETYEITPYNEFKLLSPTGAILYGVFQDYNILDNKYHYHLYVNGTADADCTHGRQVDVSILCGQTHMIPAVLESPECEFHSLLYSPWACGINFFVGNENALASATPSHTATSSGSGTGTQSPLGFATVFPSQSQTSTSSPSTTPLYMITAYPTTSPINVSPTSSPLFYLTPYPSYNPNANISAGFILGSSQSGTTSTILGAVAVGGVALGAIGFIIKHFKNGGSVGGLFKIALANKDKIQATLAKVPGANAALDKVLNDPNAKKLLSMAQNPNGAIDSLQIPDALKQSMKSALPTSQEELLKQLASGSGLEKNQTIDLSKYAKLAFEAKPTDAQTMESLKKLVTTMAAENTTGLTEQLPISKEALQTVLTPVLGATAISPTPIKKEDMAI